MLERAVVVCGGKCFQKDVPPNSGAGASVYECMDHSHRHQILTLRPTSTIFFTFTSQLDRLAAASSPCLQPASVLVTEVALPSTASRHVGQNQVERLVI